MVVAETRPIEIFISYAREDQEFKEELEKHLGSLLRTSLINVWSVDKVEAGSETQSEIEKHLNNAEIVLLLVSPDYLASDNSYSEMQRAMERFNLGFTHIMSILLRPVDLSGVPLNDSAILPKDGNPIVNWSNRDAAFFDITRSIRAQIEEIINQKRFQASLPSGTNKLAQAIIRQGKLEKAAIEKNATADIPIQDLSEDKLGFGVYVRALRDFIASQETSTPLTIGIHGSWGSGKSSLMRMLQKQLEPPLSIGRRLQLIWSRMVWFFFFFATLPIWTCGQLLLWIGGRFGGKQHSWVKQLNEDLAYDPSDPNTYSINTSQGSPQHLRFWQQIALRRYPNEPPTHPTIWFNAWKFDQEEQLWAALALEVLDQIKQKYNFPQRIIFWFSLSLKRFSLLSFLKAVALPLFFGLVDWIYTSYAKQLPNIFVQAFGFQIALGHLLLWAGILVSALIQILKIAKDPFQIEVKNVFDKPNYKDKVGFIGSFDKDFSRIVSLITKPRLGWKPRKLVIFIDDLDRCEAPKAADIIEGINLFLDAKGCVFVLGMDANAVAASIENKYKDLFQKIRQENIDIVSPGRSFLDKIIQVPFQVPASTEESMGELVKAITQPKGYAVQYQQAMTTKAGQEIVEDQTQQASAISDPTPLAAKATLPDPASYKLDDVVNAINKGAQFLPENPRQVKRFINLFRLYVYIVDSRKLLISWEGGTNKQEAGLNLERLAIWVVWSMRWGEIVKSLLEETKLSRQDLRIYLLEVSKLVHDDGSWISSGNGTVDWGHYNNILTTVTLRSKEEANSPSHWSHLPWKTWLLDKDFLICIKEMESFWQLPQSKKNDWLHILLTMNRVTFSPSTNISTDNNNLSSKKTIKLPEGTIVDEDLTEDLTTSPPQSPASPSPPSQSNGVQAQSGTSAQGSMPPSGTGSSTTSSQQSNNAQAPSAPLAQGSPSTSDTGSSRAVSSQQSNGVQAPSPTPAQVNAPTPDTDGSNAPSSEKQPVNAAMFEQASASERQQVNNDIVTIDLSHISPLAEKPEPGEENEYHQAICKEVITALRKAYEIDYDMFGTGNDIYLNIASQTGPVNYNEELREQRKNDYWECYDPKQIRDKSININDLKNNPMPLQDISLRPVLIKIQIVGQSLPQIIPPKEGIIKEVISSQEEAMKGKRPIRPLILVRQDILDKLETTRQDEINAGIQQLAEALMEYMPQNVKNKHTRIHYQVIAPWVTL